MKTKIFALLLLCSQVGFSQTMGFVTPSKVTMNITGLYLLDMSGNNVAVSSQAVPVAFSDSDKDFAQASLATISVPEGRYSGAVVSYSTVETVTLSGHPYQGQNGSQIHDGQYLCSTATGWTVSNSSTCASPQAITVPGFPGGATKSIFAIPICIATSARKAAVCSTGDIFLDAGVSSNLVFNVMQDLYNSFNVDADTLTETQTTGASGYTTLASFNFPYVSFGGLGAAIHLTQRATSSNYQTEITLLFDANKNFINAYTAEFGGGIASSASGICKGPSFVTATAAPTGKALNTWGLTFVGQFDAVTKDIAFVATGGAGTSYSGINVIHNIAQAAGTSLQMNCFADNDTTDLTAWNPLFTANLGFTYTSSSGNKANFPASIYITKVTDPTGLLGIATCGASSTTGCGAYPQ